MKISRSHATPQFEKDFLTLPKSVKRKAERKIPLFESDCFYSVLDTHKLKGKLSDFWSFAIDDDYRVIFPFPPQSGGYLLSNRPTQNLSRTGTIILVAVLKSLPTPF